MHIKKVLIVEDEPEIYLRMENIFREKGIRVLAPPGGGIIATYEAAVAAVEHEVPDFALLDIQLAGKADMDGIELGTMLKRHYRIPVLYLSGHPNDRNITRIAAAGQFGFVVKKALHHDDEQLWTSIKLELARIVQSAITQPSAPGRFLKCAAKINMEDQTPVPWNVSRVKRFFYWDDITVITIMKEKEIKSKKSTILIQEDDSKYGYIISDDSLTKIESLLPPQFIRINDREILNIDKIVAYVRTHLYTVDPDHCPDDTHTGENKNTSPKPRFTLSKNYKDKFENRLILMNKKIG